MPRGDKSSYTSKQRRQAEHIEEGYEERGVSGREAERRAWATVNKMTGGGRKSGSGRGKRTNLGPARKGGRIGGRRSAQARRARGSRGSRTRTAGKTRGRTASTRGRRRTSSGRFASKRSRSGSRSSTRSGSRRTTRGRITRRLRA